MCVNLIIAHLIACLWHSVSYFNDNRNWVISLHLNYDEWMKKYIYSFYWAIVTMMTVGYGDVTPQNELEAVCSILVIVFGCVLYAYNLNCVGILMQEIYRNQRNLETRLQIINDFMDRKKINNSLQSRIQEYIHFMWNEQKNNEKEEEKQIINSLSESLKNELLVQCYEKVFQKFPILVKYFSQKSLLKIISIIKEINFTPGEEVYAV